MIGLIQKQVGFKVGDKVFCPSIASEILEITTVPNNIFITDLTNQTNNGDYGFVKGILFGKVICLKDGICMKSYLPIVVPATPENHNLLCQLYPNVEWEKPKERKEPKEIISAMFLSGWQYVPTLIYLKSAKCDDLTLLTKGSFNSPLILERNPRPFDPKTGKEIIDFDIETGEIILE